MAVKYLKAVSNLKDKPLDKDENRLIDMVEKHIDDLINTKFDDTHISVPKYIMDFRFKESDITKHNFSSHLKSARVGIMQEEVKLRYIRAGWVWEFHQDDGLDGPNMSGPDYWILKGKE